MSSAGPLEGIKVVDLSKNAPGPMCSMILGDLGADIIRIEEPGPPTGRRAEQAAAAGVAQPPSPMRTNMRDLSYHALGRNKRSIGLNLKSAAGKEIFMRLADRADVVLEEYRPGVAKRLGIDYETLSARNPRLIYCAVTGFGQTGPYRNLVGHDLNYTATSGALSLIGRNPDEPPTIPLNLVADYAGGGMHGAIGVLAALYARNTTGRGQFVDISMLDGAMLVIAQAISGYYSSGQVPRRGEGVLSGQAPHYNVYETRDGKHITLGSLEPWFYANLCKTLGCEEFMQDEFNQEKWPTIRHAFTEKFKTKTRDEWFEILTRTDVAVGRMLTLDELENDPQVRARNMIVELDSPSGQKVKQVGISVKLSDTPGTIRSLAPSLGQHSDEILAELGYSREQAAAWREEGSIK